MREFNQTFSTGKKLLKSVLGPEVCEGARIATGDIQTGLRALLTSEGRRSAAYLSGFRNQYAGKRCVIVGNGPSLANMDLTLLKNEYTFGLNRIYLMFDRLGFTTTFYLAINRLLIQQCADEIHRLPMPKFINSEERGLFPPNCRNIAFVPSRQGHLFFSKNVVLRGLCELATVTYAALQLAYFMGFTRVILIGVDHNFVSKGLPNSVVVSGGDDPDHFDPSYFGKGFKWQLPDLTNSELAYALAKQTFEADRREVVDATVDGKLKVFRKVDFVSVLSEQYCYIQHKGSK